MRKIFLTAVALAAVSLSLAGPLFFGLNFTAGGYASEVLADVPSVYYRLEESSGTTATDASGNGRSGTYDGTGVTYSVAGGVTGNTAVTFDGSHKLESVDAPCNPGSSDFTLECWVKISSGNTGTYVAIGKINGGSESYWLGVSSGKAVFSVANALNGSISATSTANVHNDTWNHIAGVRDGTTLRMYVNGTADGTGAFSNGGSVSPNGNMMIAKFGVGLNFYFPGSLDEAAFYASKLSAARISAHYAARNAP